MKKVLVATLLAVVLATPAEANRAQSMTAPKAKFYAAKMLKAHRQFDYSDKNGDITKCKKLSRSRQRCEASWYTKRYWYEGHVTIWFKANDTRHYWYNYSLKRTNFDCLRNHSWSHCTKRIYS